MLKPDTKPNWDGKCIDFAEPWYDDNLFKIGDFNFTLGEAVAITATGMIIGVLVFSVTSYIAWKKRKAIIAAADDLGSSLRRAGTMFKTSIVGESNKILGEDKIEQNEFSN